MSIKVFTGIPGSGKTYRVLHDLVKGSWVQRFYVVHNVDGLKPTLVSPDGLISTVDEVGSALDLAPGEDFWTRPVQERLSSVIQEKYKRPVLVVVDEAQQLFGKRALTNERLEWLTYHRHLGQQVWLISQTMELLSRDVGDLAEVEVRARRGVITSSYVYQWFSNGQPFKFDRVPKDSVVYSAYTSAQLHTPGVGRSALVPMALAGVLIFGGGIYAYAGKLKGKSAPVAASSVPSVSGEVPRAPLPPPLVGPPSSPPPSAVVSGPKAPASEGPQRPARMGPVIPVSSGAPAPVRMGAAGASAPAPVAPSSGPRWVFVGCLNGEPYLWNGVDLVSAAKVLGSGWQVVGVDEQKRRLVVLSASKGPAEFVWSEVGGSAMWFGVNG